MKPVLEVLLRQLFIAALLVLLNPLVAFEQNSSQSILINHGSQDCNNNSPEQHFFSKMLTATPNRLASCNIGLDYAQVYTVYNPADNRVYFGKIEDGGTKLYAVDFNFTGTINCPPPLTTPTYIYNTQFYHLYFDPQGNAYAIYNFNSSTQSAQFRKIDIATGAPILGTDRTIVFPATDVPNSMVGDIAYLPNGRVFATFGSNPSKLYELTNINSTGNVTANFLQNLPNSSYGISFFDGVLLLSSFCNYYTWDISGSTLSQMNSFPDAKKSIDLSSMTVAVGCSKELIGSTKINANTAKLHYRLVLKNKGNISLNNIQLSDDLGVVFGTSNLSDITVSFVHNPAGLVLNADYNGVTNTKLLAPDQVLNNFPITEDIAVLDISFTATNLSLTHVYKNAAIASGDIGAGANFLAVSDSSNNGDQTKIDLNNNGVSDDAGENIPTPFIFTDVLPISDLNFRASTHNQIVKLAWEALSDQRHSTYIVARSIDGRIFKPIHSTTDIHQMSFSFTDDISLISATTIYYQLQITKEDGTTTFSNILRINNTMMASSFSVYPNPFSNHVNIQAYFTTKTKAVIIVKDITGSIVERFPWLVEKGTNYLELSPFTKLQAGTYIVEIITDTEKKSLLLVKK